MIELTFLAPLHRLMNRGLKRASVPTSARRSPDVNVWDMTPDIQALVGAGGPADSRRLADASVVLGGLLPAAAAHEP